MDSKVSTGRGETNGAAVDAQVQLVHEQDGQTSAADKERDREGGPARLHLHRGVQTVAREDSDRGRGQSEDGRVEARDGAVQGDAGRAQSGQGRGQAESGLVGAHEAHDLQGRLGPRRRRRHGPGPGHARAHTAHRLRAEARRPPRRQGQGRRGGQKRGEGRLRCLQTQAPARTEVVRSRGGARHRWRAATREGQLDLRE